MKFTVVYTGATYIVFRLDRYTLYPTRVRLGYLLLKLTSKSPTRRNLFSSVVCTSVILPLIFRVVLVYTRFSGTTVRSGQTNGGRPVTATMVRHSVRTFFRSSSPVRPNIIPNITPDVLPCPHFQQTDSFLSSVRGHKASTNCDRRKHGKYTGKTKKKILYFFQLDKIENNVLDNFASLI